MIDETMVKDLPSLPVYTKRKFLIHIGIDALSDNDYRYAKIERLITKLSDFGMDDTFFGGNVAVIAKLKDKSHYLLVNRLHQTIGICVRMDELENLNRKDLAKWAEWHHIEVGSKDSKEDIIKKLQAL
jgi:hypothetical protein